MPYVFTERGNSNAIRFIINIIRNEYVADSAAYLPWRYTIFSFEHAVEMLYIAVTYAVADFVHLQVRGVHKPLGSLQADACQVGAEGHACFFGEFGA